MSVITGISNAKLKELSKLSKKKYRDESGLFIAEGYKILDEIIEAEITPETVLVTQGNEIPDVPFDITVIPEHIMKKISTTDSVCEVLTVAKKKEYKLKDIAKFKKLALFDRIADPGNLGTIIRSAAAFGIEGIVLYGNCVDLYSPKVIRSSAGNFFKVPVVSIKSLKEGKEIFEERIKISTAPGKESTVSISKSNGAVSEKFIIMSGSEADGLCADLLNLADENIKIPMKNNVESLNLAVCASIIFYELSCSEAASV